MEHGLAQVLLLLGAAIASFLVCQRLRIPTSLSYLAVGVLLGPPIIGLVEDDGNIHLFAEFGIVFLLFTIGLNYSLPQLHALRGQVLWLGTAQVGLTTLVVGLLAWLLGAHPMAAFAIGAIFAQSSTTLISKQLSDQGEENSPHGRLGTAMSVFQDVTAVPLIVVIPVLGTAVGAAAIGLLIGTALAKAAVATLLVFFLGRWLLRPLFRVVARQRSAEAFTLLVLFVSLSAGSVTEVLGLSLAFGAFLAGMVLGETEFRHQVEATIRPFRDVLLGLFFIGIGMLFEPSALPDVWAWALGGAVVMLASKTLLVAALVRRAGMPLESAWRTGLIVAVGGEFGLALLAISITSGALDQFQSQVAFTAVLFSFILGPLLIRFSGPIARALTPKQRESASEAMAIGVGTESLERHVIVCGYGRIGQSVGHILEQQGIAWGAMDLDLAKVRQARQAGEPVFFGDASDPAMLESMGLDRARLVVLSNDDTAASLRVLGLVRARHPRLPVLVRTRDDSQLEALREAGATEIVPETLEAGLMIATHVLDRLHVAPGRILELVEEQRAARYPLLRARFAGEVEGATPAEQLSPVALPPGCNACGKTLQELGLGDGAAAAIVRDGERLLDPAPGTVLAEGDTVVLRGTEDEVARAASLLQGA